MAAFSSHCHYYLPFTCRAWEAHDFHRTHTHGACTAAMHMPAFGRLYDARLTWAGAAMACRVGAPGAGQAGGWVECHGPDSSSVKINEKEKEKKQASREEHWLVYQKFIKNHLSKIFPFNKNLSYNNTFLSFLLFLTFAHSNKNFFILKILFLSY